MKKIQLLSLFLVSTFLLDAQNFGLSLDGAATGLEVSHKPALNVTDTYTIEAWIYANAWKSQAWMGSIVNKDTQGPDRGYAFRAGDNGRLSFVMAVDNAWEEVATSSIMNVEQWHHVAIVINNGIMTLYIDGQASANKTYTGTISTNDLNLNIGSSPGFGGRHFDGIIDEVRMWNVAKTQSEIADNISTAYTGSEANLMAYFPMNEGTGTTTTNLVDANCSAVFLNMDESNWVGGFTIPEYDVSLLPIGGIDVVNMKTRPIKLSVDLKNLGLESLSDINLTVAVNGNDQFTETVSQTLLSGDQINYQLRTPVDLIGINNPELSITASHPEDQNLLNNNKSLIISTQAGNTVRLFEAKTHNFGSGGQNHFSSVVLPASLEQYERLLLHIDLSCPSGGCDPWDQPAKVNAETSQGTFEIARYITPYGIACGPWTVDVTDFKDVLAGPVTFHSFVQVWGQSGWSVTIDLELVEGNDPFPFYKISPLWETDYWVYGDPSIDDNLPPVSVDVDNLTEASHIRMTISGHGQGNTNNAAEFSQTTHNFMLNGNVIDNHFLWKPDCSANVCANQAGNWLFPRAGWCPGQEVIPYTVATTSAVSAGATVELDYDLQDYTNLLNTGYNGNTHTEPHYRIWSYFIEQSSQRYEDYRNLVSDAITPTISGSGGGQNLDALSITIRNNGSENIADFMVSYYIDNVLIASEMVNTSLAPGATWTHDFSTLAGFNPGVENTFFGVVSHPSDQNFGDDVSKFLFGGVVSTNEVAIAAANLQVAPNPVTAGQIQINSDPILEGSRLELIDVNGQVLQRTLLQSNTTNLSINAPSGIYFLSITHKNGFNINKKLVVTQ
ncbi:MAG: LamG-like jellyroll fold domain-containing protein [Bacteroidota bacterium]